MRNRIAIILDKDGFLERVACDTDCRIFIVDRKCASEPVYELSSDGSKNVGVEHVRAALGDDLAATGDSVGPWKPTSFEIGTIKK